MSVLNTEVVDEVKPMEIDVTVDAIISALGDEVEQFVSSRALNESYFKFRNMIATINQIGHLKSALCKVSLLHVRAAMQSIQDNGMD